MQLHANITTFLASEHVFCISLCSCYGDVIIPHVLYHATTAEETIQFISVTTGRPVTELLTNCLPLCMSLVLSSYAIQHHSGEGSKRDEHPVALHNLLLIHLSEEVMYGCLYVCILCVGNVLL